MPGHPDDRTEVNRLIDAFADKFNHTGHHRSLGCLVPEEALKADKRW